MRLFCQSARSAIQAAVASLSCLTLVSGCGEAPAHDASAVGVATIDKESFDAQRVLADAPVSMEAPAAAPAVFCCAEVHGVGVGERLMLWSDNNRPEATGASIPYNGKGITVRQCIYDGREITGGEWAALNHAEPSEADLVCKVNSGSDSGWTQGDNLRPEATGEDTTNATNDAEAALAAAGFDINLGLNINYAEALGSNLDLTTPGFSARVSGRDNWSRFDLWYFTEHQRDESVKELLAAGGQSNLASVTPALKNAVDVFAIATLIEKHPDWTADDITIELRVQHKAELYGPWYNYLIPNRLTRSLLRVRVSRLNAAFTTCGRAYEQLRPTQRPSQNLEAACKAAILYRGEPEPPASSE